MNWKKKYHEIVFENLALKNRIGELQDYNDYLYRKCGGFIDEK